MHSTLIYLQNHSAVRYVLLGLVFLLIGMLLSPFWSKSSKTGEFSYKDLPNIAGDDVLATQLDLVKAYIEMGQKNLAKSLLKQAIKTSRAPQKKDLKYLLKTL